jgi:hypothetical protein
MNTGENKKTSEESSPIMNSILPGGRALRPAKALVLAMMAPSTSHVADIWTAPRTALMPPPPVFVRPAHLIP